MTTPLRGMLVHVLRPTTDCTNGGITMKHDTFVLVGEGIPEIFAACPDTPALMLVRNQFGCHARPVDAPTGDKVIGPMFGGCFVTSSDSRMPAETIRVHDRFETQAQYDAFWD